DFGQPVLADAGGRFHRDLFFDYAAGHGPNLRRNNWCSFFLTGKNTRLYSRRTSDDDQAPAIWAAMRMVAVWAGAVCGRRTSRRTVMSSFCPKAHAASTICSTVGLDAARA